MGLINESHNKMIPHQWILSEMLYWWFSITPTRGQEGGEMGPTRSIPLIVFSNRECPLFFKYVGSQLGTIISNIIIPWNIEFHNNPPIRSMWRVHVTFDKVAEYTDRTVSGKYLTQFDCHVRDMRPHNYHLNSHITNRYIFDDFFFKKYVLLLPLFFSKKS